MSQRDWKLDNIARLANMLNSVAAELKAAEEELEIVNSRIRACKESCKNIQDGIFDCLKE